MNTALVTQGDGASVGLGLATPVHQVQTVVEQLIQHGRVIRGWMGVRTRDLDIEQQRQLTHGVVVVGVIEGGPAERAGINADDVITEVDGRRISNSRALLTFTTTTAPGSAVLVAGLRAGRPFEARVVLIQRPIPQRRP